MTFLAGNRLTAAKLNPSVFCRYQTVSQTNLPDGGGGTGQRVVLFDMAQTSTPDVSYDTATGVCTINRTGWWRSEAGLALNSDGNPTNIGERLLTIVRNPTSVTAGAWPTYTGGTPIARDSDHVATAFTFLNCSRSRLLTAGDTLIVTVNVNSTAGTLDTYISGEQTFISLTCETDL
jgi:hypothetical protein